MWDKADGTMVGIPSDGDDCVHMRYKIILRCGIVSERVTRLRDPSSRDENVTRLVGSERLYPRYDAFRETLASLSGRVTC